MANSAEQQIRVGVVGCGQIARVVHLGVLSDLRGARLAAIAEPDDASRAAAIARSPGVAAFSDYHDLLALEDVDAVVLSLPPGLHAPAATAAFEAGKHVYLEKPLAIDLESGRAVLASWRASGRVGMIGFNYRFNRLHLEARQVLGTGRLGAPVAIRSIFSNARRPLPAWKCSRASGGGVLLDLASHHIDLVRFLSGATVRDVSCSLHSVESEDDTATLQMRMSSDLLAQSMFSLCGTDEDRLEIYCERGSIKVERRHGLAIELSRGIDYAHRLDRIRHAWHSLRSAGYAIEKFRAFGHEPSWRSALEHFIGAASGAHTATPDLEDGYRSLEVVLAAEESARASRAVQIE